MNIHWFAACAAFLVYVIISLKFLDMLRGIGNMLFLAFSGSTVSLPQQCGAACKVNMRHRRKLLTFQGVHSLLSTET